MPDEQRKMRLGLRLFGFWLFGRARALFFGFCDCRNFFITCRFFLRYALADGVCFPIFFSGETIFSDPSYRTAFAELCRVSASASEMPRIKVTENFFQSA